MPKVSRYVWTLNKQQQRSLKALFDRHPIYREVPALQGSALQAYQVPLTYRQFRKDVHINTLLNCAMVQWCGMWIGIETDGYTHS
jgi:hypothetical protein